LNMYRWKMKCWLYIEFSEDVLASGASQHRHLLKVS
jgi:hypothetical protein